MNKDVYNYGTFLCSWPQRYSTLIWGCSRWIRSPMLGSARAFTLR